MGLRHHHQLRGLSEGRCAAEEVLTAIGRAREQERNERVSEGSAKKPGVAVPSWCCMLGLRAWRHSSQQALSTVLEPFSWQVVAACMCPLRLPYRWLFRLSTFAQQCLETADNASYAVQTLTPRAKKSIGVRSSRTTSLESTVAALVQDLT